MIKGKVTHDTHSCVTHVLSDVFVLRLSFRQHDSQHLSSPPRFPAPLSSNTIRRAHPPRPAFQHRCVATRFAAPLSSPRFPAPLCSNTIRRASLFAPLSSNTIRRDHPLRPTFQHRCVATRFAAPTLPAPLFRPSFRWAFCVITSAGTSFRQHVRHVHLPCPDFPPAFRLVFSHPFSPVLFLASFFLPSFFSSLFFQSIFRKRSEKKDAKIRLEKKTREKGWEKKGWCKRRATKGSCESGTPF